MIRSNLALGLGLFVPIALLLACGGDGSERNGHQGGSAGAMEPAESADGARSGGAGTSGGSVAAGGAVGFGGVTPTGGVRVTGGTMTTGGATATGGAIGTGGVGIVGGAFSTGGVGVMGGTMTTGGVGVTGGTMTTGGARATGGVTYAGGNTNPGGEAAGGQGATGGLEATGGDVGTGGIVGTASCEALTNDPSVNWRDSALRTDQEIVECLATSLGTPVGYGENATGGYDPAGGSRLVVITRDPGESVEQQLLNAIGTEDHKWIVFDKEDFAEPYEVAMYRLWCDDEEVLSAIGASSAESCRDHRLWCAEHGVAAADCVEQFFNVTLNDGELPIRVNQIHSNTTIDGRGSQAYIFFSGFKIGADSDSQPTHTDQNVIVTNLRFQGAGHTEDHDLDPDMIRSTGGSRDIWIHQNTFDTTGDSAWDVKVGAHHITMSFNLVRNVQRTCLHASGDSETVSTAIATTMHNNAFVTTDDLFESFGQGGRRVPLIRFGKSHLFNNVFFNYRRQVVSVRVGARLFMNDNVFLVNAASAASRDDDLPYYVENLLAGFEEDGGGLEVVRSRVWLSDPACRLDPSDSGDLAASHGSAPDPIMDYNEASRVAIAAHLLSAGAELADYVFATAGKGAATPFNSPYTLGREAILALGRGSCQ
ncbi:MAG: hypothetical protein JW751_05300 [Polyangiaceae bacterium]|nr:hypothetical protein [Polyangiaceae bacterium]